LNRLSGSLLFPGNDFQEVFAKNKACIVEFREKYWSGISAEAKDLVSKMLEVDVKKRISCEDILKHGWIVANTEEKKVTVK
jgi:serine/threonine protein kinase